MKPPCFGSQVPLKARYYAFVAEDIRRKVYLLNLSAADQQEMLDLMTELVKSVEDEEDENDY